MAYAHQQQPLKKPVAKSFSQIHQYQQKSKEIVKAGKRRGNQVQITKSFNKTKPSQDGSVERKEGDDDDHCTQEPDAIERLEQPSNLEDARRQPLGIQFTNENIIESKAYLSNLPNTAFISTKAQKRSRPNQHEDQSITLNLQDPESQVLEPFIYDYSSNGQSAPTSKYLTNDAACRVKKPTFNSGYKSPRSTISQPEQKPIESPSSVQSATSDDQGNDIHMITQEKNKDEREVRIKHSNGVQGSGKASPVALNLKVVSKQQSSFTSKLMPMSNREHSPPLMQIQAQGGKIGLFGFVKQKQIHQERELSKQREQNERSKDRLNDQNIQKQTVYKSHALNRQIKGLKTTKIQKPGQNVSNTNVLSIVDKQKEMQSQASDSADLSHDDSSSLSTPMLNNDEVAREQLQAELPQTQKQGAKCSKIVPPLALDKMQQKQPTQKRLLNNTMNRFEIRQLMTKSANLERDLNNGSRNAFTQRNHNPLEDKVKIVSTYGHVKRATLVATHRPQTQQSHRESEEIFSSQGSNCTQHKDFTPGQHQFKAFLKQQGTVERQTCPNSNRELLTGAMSLRQYYKQANLAKKLDIQLIRSNTKQVESKEETRADIPNSEEVVNKGRVRHLKTNSNIGSIRMSPTPQALPVDIFSSEERIESSGTKQNKSLTIQLKQTEYRDLPSPSRDLPATSSYKHDILLTQPAACEDSATLSNLNFSVGEEINEKTQPLSGILRQLNMQSAAQNQSTRKTRLFQRSMHHQKLNHVYFNGQVPKNAGESSDVSSIQPSPFQKSKEKRRKQDKVATTFDLSRNEDKLHHIQVPTNKWTKQNQNLLKDTNETSIMKFSKEDTKLATNVVPSQNVGFILKERSAQAQRAHSSEAAISLGMLGRVAADQHSQNLQEINQLKNLQNQKMGAEQTKPTGNQSQEDQLQMIQNAKQALAIEVDQDDQKLDDLDDADVESVQNGMSTRINPTMVSDLQIQKHLGENYIQPKNHPVHQQRPENKVNKYSIAKGNKGKCNGNAGSKRNERKQRLRDILNFDLEGLDLKTRGQQPIKGEISDIDDELLSQTKTQLPQESKLVNINQFKTNQPPNEEANVPKNQAPARKQPPGKEISSFKLKRHTQNEEQIIQSSQYLQLSQSTKGQLGSQSTKQLHNKQGHYYKVSTANPSTQVKSPNFKEFSTKRTILVKPIRESQNGATSVEASKLESKKRQNHKVSNEQSTFPASRKVKKNSQLSSISSLQFSKEAVEGQKKIEKNASQSNLGPKRQNGEENVQVSSIKPQKAARDYQKRQERVRSLYATAGTKDLTLDLSKINKEMLINQKHVKFSGRHDFDEASDQRLNEDRTQAVRKSVIASKKGATNKLSELLRSSSSQRVLPQLESQLLDAQDQELDKDNVAQNQSRRNPSLNNHAEVQIQHKSFASQLMNKIQDMIVTTNAPAESKFKERRSAQAVMDGRTDTTALHGERKKYLDLNAHLMNEQAVSRINLVQTTNMHPKTTKNNQSSGAMGDRSSIQITLTPPESQRSTRRHVNGGSTTVHTLKAYNQLRNNYSNFREQNFGAVDKAKLAAQPHQSAKMPLSARGSSNSAFQAASSAKAQKGPVHFHFRNVTNSQVDSVHPPKQEIDQGLRKAGSPGPTKQPGTNQGDKEDPHSKQKLHDKSTSHQRMQQIATTLAALLHAQNKSQAQNSTDVNTSYNEPGTQNGVYGQASASVTQTANKGHAASVLKLNTSFAEDDQLDYVSMDSETQKEMIESAKNEHLTGYKKHKLIQTAQAPESLETQQQQRQRKKMQEGGSQIQSSATKQHSIYGIQRPKLEMGDSPKLPDFEHSFQPDPIKDKEQREEAEILKSLPFNGCSCNSKRGSDDHQKKGCLNTAKWLNLAYKEDNYLYLSSYKLYQGFLLQAMNEGSSQTEQEIQDDLERTFQHVDYFRKSQLQQGMKRVLLAFSNYEKSVGYVQGMNFIVAALIYHTGEVAAFWLLCFLMERHELKRVLSAGMEGLHFHEQQIEKLGRQHLPELFRHFDKTYVSISLFTTDWIISIFLNFVPLDLTHIYFDVLFEHGWSAFYELIIQLLRQYEKDLLKLHDAGEIVGLIKQTQATCLSSSLY